MRRCDVSYIHRQNEQNIRYIHMGKEKRECKQKERWDMGERETRTHTHTRERHTQERQRSHSQQEGEMIQENHI